MSIKVGSVWRCIDHQDSDLIGQTCTVLSVNNNPDYNGDGDIELRYEDGTLYTGKYRRFVPGITHIQVFENSVYVVYHNEFRGNVAKIFKSRNKALEFIDKGNGKYSDFIDTFILE